MDQILVYFRIPKIHKKWFYIVINLLICTGEPGRVHVSEATYKFLKDEYEVEPGETVEGEWLVQQR